MQSHIVQRSAAALATAGRDLRARVMLSAAIINACPSVLWAAAPAHDSRTTERSSRALDATDPTAER